MLVIWIYAFKLSLTCLEDFIPLYWNVCYQDYIASQMILALKTLATSPTCKTKQILDTLSDADVALILIKYTFSPLHGKLIW